MTSLCFISDTHKRHRELVIPPCDLLIHCGDMGSFQRDDAGTLKDIDQWFAEIPAKRVVCIGGNHDFMLQNREFRFVHAEYLCDRLIKVDPSRPGTRLYANGVASDSLGLPTTVGHPRFPAANPEPQRGSGAPVSRSPETILEFLNQKAGTTLWFGNTMGTNLG